MSDVVVSKLPIGLFVGYFIAYVIIHGLIGYYLKKIRYEAAKNPKDEDIKNVEKWTTIAFRWFPAAYVVFLLLSLYV